MGKRLGSVRERPASGASLTGWFLAGGVGWTFLEYALHRFAMHEMKGKGLASREHLTHHADVTYFSPTSKKALTAVGVTAGVLPTSWPVLGRNRAIALVAGFNITYVAYEVIHRRAHTHPPRNKYGRWLRKSHFHHHFGAPRRNHGVTTPVWDKVFGTYDEPGTLRVPRRMAMTWLLDENGDVKPEFAADYEVIGKRPMTDDQRADDKAKAFANLIPAV
jgi:sterol desaturase/sphingolipid hydroxylase (fatty acid hydroxylase superfamily)